MAKDTKLTIQVSDGDTLKDLQKKLKKAAGGFDALSTSQRGADRAGKGLSRQSSNQTKNFSKIQQGISGGLVPAYATLAAQVFAVSAAFQFLKESVNFRNLIQGQEAFGSITGTAYKTVTKAVREATQGQLAYQDAAQAVAIGTAAGLSRGQLEDLGTAAKNTSLALGRDLSDSFNRLVRGVTKAEPELLDELGIILRLDPALKNYASSIGKTKEELNQFEKSQAIANEVLGQADEKFGRITEIMDPAAFALGQFGAAFNDLVNLLRDKLGFLAEKILPFFTDNVYALTAALSLFALPILKTILPNFDAMGDAAEKNMKRASSAVLTAQKDLDKLSGDNKGIRQDSRAGINKLRAGKNLGPTPAMFDQMNQREIDAQRKALEKGGALRKLYEKKERAEYRMHLQRQETALKISEGKKRGEFTKTTSWFKLQMKKKELIQKKANVKMVAASKATANLMNKAFMVAGVLGVLTLIGSMVMMAIDHFRTVDEALEKNKERMNELRESAKGVTEELQRMNQVANEGLISRRDAVLQGANAILSVDPNRMIQDYNKIRTGEGAFAETGRKNVYAAGMKGEGAQYDTAEELLKAEGELSLYMRKVVSFTEMTPEFVKSAKQTAAAFRELAQTQSDPALIKGYAQVAEEIETGTELNNANLQVIAERENAMKSLAVTLKGAAQAEKTYNNALMSAVGKKMYGAQLKSGAQGMANVAEAQIERDYLALQKISGGADLESEDDVIRTRAEQRLAKNYENDVGGYRTSIENTQSRKKGYQDVVAEIVRINNSELESIKNGTTLRDLQMERSKDVGIEQKITAMKNDDTNVAIRQQKNLITNAQRAADIAKIEMDAEKDPKRKELKKSLYDLAVATVEAEEGYLPIIKEVQDREAAKLELKKQQYAQEIEMNKLRMQEMDYQIKNAGFAAAYGATGFGKTELAKRKLESDSLKIAMKKQKITDDLANRNKQIADELVIAGSIEDQRLLNKIDMERKRLELMEKQLEVSEFSNSELGKLQMSFAKGIEDMFVSIAQGSKSAKEAFADLAVFMLKKIAEMAAQQLAMKAIMAMGLPIPMAKGGVIPMAKGGVIPRYASGGVATEPTYLVGEGRHNEAVVPLPDGRSIPVDMQGGSGTNNVSINVNVDGSSSNVANGEQGKALGKMMEIAVMEVIQREKRPGGVLGR